MLRSLDVLEEGFRSIAKRSKEECGNELEKIRQLTVSVIPQFFKPIEKRYNVDEAKQRNSLVLTCFFELFRISGHILFLSCNGLYRNAFDDIRYILESIVQALYIDLRHPKTDIFTKIEILKEVEDKREYHAARLIDELEIDFKDKLKKEYKNLSRRIHPTHEQVKTTISDILERKGVPITINCAEVSNIYDSLRKMYDIFLFLCIAYFPETKELLQKNLDFIKSIKVYNLTLLSRVFRVRL